MKIRVKEKIHIRWRKARKYIYLGLFTRDNAIVLSFFFSSSDWWIISRVLNFIVSAFDKVNMKNWRKEPPSFFIQEHVCPLNAFYWEINWLFHAFAAYGHLINEQIPSTMFYIHLSKWATSEWSFEKRGVPCLGVKLTRSSGLERIILGTDFKIET